MKRWMVILTLVVSLLVVLAALPAAAQDDEHGEEADHSEDVLRGAAVYATYCQACHGPTGEALGTGAAFAAITYDHDTAHEAILAGGALMPAYEDVLDAAEVDELLAYMATWEAGNTPPLPKPNLHDLPESVPDYFGDVHEGAVVYASFCAGCHGAEGAGSEKFDTSKIELTAQTMEIVANEHVPAFGEDSGGPLNDEQLIDLETYLASWQLESDEPDDSGINLLIVVMGAAAILVVGAVYWLRRGEDEPGKIV